MNTHDTIAAPATAIGGAVTIIRISGKKTLEILNTVWQGKKKITSLDARMMLLGKVAGEPALAVFMPGPKSYTGEDVGEIHIHGGPVSASLTLQLLYEAGCRAAQGGEFTFRAFINGKLDLTQAEAVADLVSSNSTLARNLANSQLSGSLKRKIDELYELLDALRSECEARLDFPDEDLTFPPLDTASCTAIEEKIQSLLRTRKAGSNLREGVKIVLAGHPNAGKSSLLNQLLGFDRSIVSDIPGTTRDTIESDTTLRNIAVKLTDTAGLRDSNDPIEQLGVQRSKQSIENAAITFWLLDSTSTNKDDEITKLASLSNSNNTIAIWNKIDLLSDTEVANLPQVGVKTVKISALSGLGIEELLDAFEELVWEGKVPQTLPDCAINARSADALEKALFALKLAKDNIEVNELELAAYDLATAAREVGIVTGRTVEPDLLDRVFSNFCIGK